MKEEFNFKECPKQRDILPYLILELHKLGGEARKRDVVDGLAKLFDLSDEILEETLGSGAPKFNNTVAWAREQLRQTGYIDNETYGIWGLTQKGRGAAKQLESRARKDLDAFRGSVSEEARTQKEKTGDNGKDGEGDTPAPETGEDDHEERLRQRLRQDLEKVKEIDPYAFERLCAGLLRTSGYVDVEVTKRSSDGGIDGLGFLTIGLIRFKIVFQAKRHKKPVGPGDLQKFATAKRKANAEKAIFITTSKFTKGAEETAGDDSIDLINGENLMRLLFEMEVGYRKILDDDFLRKL